MCAGTKKKEKKEEKGPCSSLRTKRPSIWTEQRPFSPASTNMLAGSRFPPENEDRGMSLLGLYFFFFNWIFGGIVSRQRKVPASLCHHRGPRQTIPYSGVVGLIGSVSAAPFHPLLSDAPFRDWPELG